MKIIIEDGEPRNDDLGDWWVDRGVWHIVARKGLPFKTQLAIAVHELAEMKRCEEDGVTDQQVTAFDAQFLNEQMAGKHSLDEEPGMDSRSPYKRQHAAATFAERAFCEAIKLDWDEHEANCLKAYVD